METETITHVAIEFDDMTLDLPAPARHSDVIALHVKLTGERGSGRQGFITSTGRFVDRTIGAMIAYSSPSSSPHTRGMSIYPAFGNSATHQSARHLSMPGAVGFSGLADATAQCAPGRLLVRVRRGNSCTSGRLS